MSDAGDGCDACVARPGAGGCIARPCGGDDLAWLHTDSPSNDGDVLYSGGPPAWAQCGDGQQTDGLFTGGLDVGGLDADAFGSAPCGTRQGGWPASGGDWPKWM